MATALDRFICSLPAATHKPANERIFAEAAEALTRREAEVLSLIAGGRSNREIADQLVLSVRKVERHITNIYGKIGAASRADATVYALRHALA